LNESIINEYCHLISDRSQLLARGVLIMPTRYYSDQLLRGQGRGERGLTRHLKLSLTNIPDLRSVLVPCHVRGNHWALLELDACNGRAIWHDSLLPSLADPLRLDLIATAESCVGQLQVALQNVELLHSTEFACPKGSGGKIATFKFAINDDATQQEPDSMDCGVHVLLRARSLATGEVILLSEASTLRAKIAVELEHGQLSAAVA
jgi:Ulp1 family protease